MYKKPFTKGEAVNWSFLVKGPANISNRCDPELAIMKWGIDARVLLIEIAVGMALQQMRPWPFNMGEERTYFLDIER